MNATASQNLASGTSPSRPSTSGGFPSVRNGVSKQQGSYIIDEEDEYEKEEKTASDAPTSNIESSGTEPWRAANTIGLLTIKPEIFDTSPQAIFDSD